MEKKYKPFGIVAALIVGTVLGFQINQVFSGDNLRENIIKFNHVLSYTSKYYIDDVDSYKLVETAIKAMLGELDPHTVYLPVKKQQDETEKFQGNFEGIGIEFSIVNDTITVVSPLTGGPSEALGIFAGDRIIKIENKSAIGFDNDDVRKHLRGEKGSKVNITIYRHSDNKFYDFEIIRDKIPIFSVTAKLMWDDETGYISLSRFATTSTTEMLEAMGELKTKGMKRLVLDLRNNPGGLLAQAFSVTDLFIDGEKMIVYTKSRVPELDQQFFASVQTEFENIPLIILVNRGSASASEILSGAVQDWDRGLIVGETTFGKGLVQRVFTLPDQSAVRITTSKYYTPVGRQIQRDYTDKKNYYKEIHQRNEVEGNNIKHEAESDTTRPLYSTKGGRQVFGGGGITPDVILKNDTLTTYTANLRRKNLFYLFTRNFLDLHKDEIVKRFGDDLSKYKNDFVITDSILKDFTKFAESKNVEYNETKIERDKNFIAASLKAQIAREFWKNDGYYYIILNQDEVFVKSTKLFNEVDKITKL